MLATCYFMQTFIALVKSIDNNQLFMSISSYVEIFHSIVKCFKDNIMIVNEPLTMETVLIMIEYWQVLSFYTLTHEYLIDHNVVRLMIESLEKHTHPVMTKAIAGVLFSFGDLKSFSDQFTQEGSIEIILSMVILN